MVMDENQKKQGRNMVLILDFRQNVSYNISVFEYAKMQWPKGFVSTDKTASLGKRRCDP